MFGRLKKSLKEGISKLSKKVEKEKVEPKADKPMEKPKVEEKAVIKEEPKPVVEEKPVEIKPEPLLEPEIKEPEEPIEPPEKPGPEEIKAEVKEKPKPKKLGFMERFSKKILTENDIDSFFKEGEMELLQSDVALEVIDSLKSGLKKRLVDNPVKRGDAIDIVENAFKDSLVEIVDQGSVNIDNVIKDAKKNGKVACIVFLGFNGSGKTTSIARIANYLKKKGYNPVLAAGDTFRAASIEQLEVHGNNLGLKVIKHDYGSDAAAVIFDAVKYAKGNDNDVVLADTAGRSHKDKNLMDELKKVIRVNSPELKILVVDSLTGNDAVEQARNFDETAGVDSVVMTKTDVNPKGGSILSVCFAIKKPILFLGTGQEYEDIEIFKPEDFVKQLMD